MVSAFSTFETATLPPAFAWAVGLLLSAALGSFLSSCVHRLPIRYHNTPNVAGPWSIVRGRSRCPACGHVLKARHLVPLLSWLALRGRCGWCRSAISGLYPGMELVSVASFVVAALVSAERGELLALAALGPVLIALAVIDLRHMILPDALVAALAVPPVALALTAPGAEGAVLEAILGTTFAGGTFWTVRLLYRAIRGVPGLGMGDVKLAAVAGAWIGPSGFAPMVLAACGATAVGLLAHRLIRRRRTRRFDAGTRVPFGPGLAFGFYCVAVAQAAGVL